MSRLIDADALLEFFKSMHISGNTCSPEDVIKALTNAPTVEREGWVSVPVEPDKATFIGEFSIDVTHHCSACAFLGVQEDCEVCSGNVEYVQKHTIPWTTFKKMYAEIVSAAPKE